MPALSPTMEKGNLAKWLKKEGDSVKSGDVIAEIETDKATMEVEAVDEGTLGKILVPEGTNDVAVNTPIAMILGEGEDAASLKGNGGAPKPPPKPEQPAQEQKGAASAPPAEKPEPAKQAEAPAPAQTGTAKPPSADLMPEPEVPEGTELVTMTMREALRDAMAEEMRRDADVFVMGEEVAEYQGAYKVTQGLLEEFGAERVIDTPITEHGFAGVGIGAALAGLKADRRIHDLQFRHAGDGPAHQFGGEDPVHVRRPGEAVDRVSRSERRRIARRRAAQPGLFVLVFAHSRPESDRSIDRGRRQGLAQGRDPRSQSGDVSRK